MLEIRLEGRGGQGVVVGAEVLGSAVTKSGRYAQKIPVYSGARRGERVMAFIRIDDSEILERCDIYEPDWVVSFDSQFLVSDLATGLKAEGALLLNSAKAPSEVTPVCSLIGTVNGDGIAAEVYGLSPIRITNMAMCGALSKMAGFCSFEHLEEAISEKFSGKNRERSILAARLGYDSVAWVRPTEIVASSEGLQEKHSPRPVLPLSPIVFPSMVRDMKTGSWRSTDPVVDSDTCRGCGICCSLCPEGIVTVENGVAEIDYDYCKGCGICVEVCPTHAIKMVEKGVS